MGERGWLMLKKKNHNNKNKKNNKNTAFVRKEGKEIFFGETKKCSAKMLVDEVVPQKITEEFTFANELLSRTSYAEQFPILSSKYYENNICFSLVCINWVSND